MSDEGKLILVVDDDRRTRDMVASFLEEEGFTCLTASNGEKALELLATQNFEVVLSDVRMPNLDGISLVKRGQQIDPTLPVVLVTGESVFDTAVLAVQHGAFDYIVKPFSLQELDSAVRRALDRRTKLRGTAAPAAAQPAEEPAPQATVSSSTRVEVAASGTAALRAAAERLGADVNAAVDQYLAQLRE